MDIAGPLVETPTPKWNKYILVIQDYYSKWIELFPLAHHSAKDVAGVLLYEFTTLYGVWEWDRNHLDQALEFDSA